MSRNAKIGIAVVVAIIVLCLCVCAGGALFFTFAGGRLLENMAIDDPEAARTMAADMVAYELPAGFREAGAVNFFYGKMIMIEADSPGTMIMLAQITTPGVIDTDQFRRQMEQSMQRQSVDWELVSDETRSLRGYDTTVYVYEGDGSAGRMRQLVTELFPGKQGEVFIMAVGPAASWPAAEIDAFLDSIE